MDTSRTFISVVGGSQCSAEAYALAEEVGRELARRGAVVVCGGLTGVMEAACKGAKSAGGVTVGIIPSGNHLDANPWVDIPVVTNIGYARNVMVVKTGRAVIAVDGSYGTLSEIAIALAEGIPVVGLRTWTFSYNNHEKAANAIVHVSTPAEAVERALDLAKQREELLKAQRVGQ